MVQERPMMPGQCLRSRGDARPASELAATVLAALLDKPNSSTTSARPTWGLRGLDQWNIGPRRGDLIVLAARPAMGSTALALQLACNVALQHSESKPPTSGNRVVVLSLNLGHDEIMLRLLSARSRVPLPTLRSGALTAADAVAVRQAAGQLGAADLHVDFTPGLTTAELWERCEQLAKAAPLKLVVVDGLHDVRASGKVFQGAKREVAEVTRLLRDLASGLDCTVLALSTLPRPSRRRRTEKYIPRLDDLREFPSIVRDAEMVWFLHRDHYYDPEAPADEAQVVIAQERSGMIGTILLHFDGTLMQYSNWV